MKKLISLLIFAFVFVAGSVCVTTITEAKTTKKATTTSNKGYKISNGRIIVTGSKPVVVDFNATWCGPCREFAPVFERAKSECKSKAILIGIDVDKYESVANYYNINAIPTIYMIYPNGSIIEYNGPRDITSFKNWIIRNS